MEFVSGAKRVVIKIGSSLLVDQKTSSIRAKWLHSLSEDIRDMHSNGIEVVIVSSIPLECISRISSESEWSHLALIELVF
jgi:glutamate 5-kinase